MGKSHKESQLNCFWLVGVFPGDSFCQQLWATKSTLQPAWAWALDMASNAGGVLVVSSFAPHLGNSFDVVGCKTIGI